MKPGDGVVAEYSKGNERKFYERFSVYYDCHYQGGIFLTKYDLLIQNHHN